MADELMDNIRAQFKKKPEEASTGPGAIDYLGGFLRSAVSSPLEMFGADPVPGAEGFRRDNPIGGFVSEFAGLAIPYTGWLKATTAIPRFEKTIEAVGKISKSPLISGAAKEVTRFGPLEAAAAASRIGFGDQDPIEAISEGAFNTALAGGVGAVGGLLSAAGKSLTKNIFEPPGVDLRAPLQMQSRQLKETMQKGEIPEELLPKAEEQLRDYSRQIRLETLGKGERYVNDLEGEANGQEVNRLFSSKSGTEPGENAVLRRMRLAQTSTDFADQASWRNILKENGIAETDVDLMQFPRYINFGGKNPGAAGKASKMITSSVERNMSSIGDNWWWAKEAEDGLYVMAKKIPQEGKKDSWLVFKTDAPGRFVPVQQQWADKIVRNSAFLKDGRDVPVGVDIYDFGKKITQELPMTTYNNLLGPKGNTALAAERVKKALGIDNAKGILAERGKQFIDEFLAPTVFQFRNSPRAKWIFNVARSIHDSAGALAQTMLHGDVSLAGKKSIWGDIFSIPKQTGGVLESLRKLSDEDVAQVWRAWNEQLSPQKAAALGASNDAVNFLKKLSEADRQIVDRIKSLQSAGIIKDKFTPIENHYMISRSWKGDHRVDVRDEANNLVFLASGDTRNAAIKEAEGIVRKANAEGKAWKVGDWALADRTKDFELAARLPIKSEAYNLAANLRTQVNREARAPKFHSERSGMAGYIGESAPFTKDELADIIKGHVNQQFRYIAESSANDLLAGELAKLSQANPALFNQVTQRLNDLSGKPGPIAQSVNNLTDKVLSPVLGKNSATKIVRTANELMFHYTLGFGNLGFVAVNALTFLQTTLPHMAYVLSATPDRIAKYYSWFPAAGAQGLPKGGVGAVDMLKLLKEGFRQMGKPSAELKAAFERATKEGVTDPRFVEEALGENSRQVLNLKEALKSGGYVSWMKAVSGAGPSASEKLARGQAFVQGHIIGKDFLKLSDENLYRFAKEFTNNTMFLYGTADRARLITGPVGSLFGLFKNWQMHYMGWMMEYVGEAAMRGNWKPLLWMTAGTGSVAGAGGLPLYGAANIASQWLSDRSAMENIYRAFGASGTDHASTSDAVFMGLPAYLGVSLQGSAAAPFADPARDASMLFSFVHLDRMKAIGQAAGKAIDRWSATGEHPIDGPIVRDAFIRAFTPKSVYRAAAVWEDNYVKSLSTGYPQMKDVSPTERLLYAAGINPRRLELQYKVGDELWKKQTAMKEATQAMGEAWAQAQSAGDSKTMWAIMQQAMVKGVDISSVIKSANSRLAKGREDMIERQFDPRAIAGYRQLGLYQ